MVAVKDRRVLRITIVTPGDFTLVYEVLCSLATSGHVCQRVISTPLWTLLFVPDFGGMGCYIDRFGDFSPLVEDLIVLLGC